MSLYSTQETTSDAQGENGRHQHIAGHLNYPGKRPQTVSKEKKKTMKGRDTTGQS